MCLHKNGSHLRSTRGKYLHTIYLFIQLNIRVKKKIKDKNADTILLV